MKRLSRVHRGKPTPLRDLVASVTGLATEQVSLIIAMGGAYLGKRRVKDGGHRVRDGQTISVYYQLPLEMNPVAFDPRWILVERDGFLVADKPAGLPTQGRRDADYMAFYELLKGHLDGYLGLHHRLDQGTSGLLLFTRDRALNKSVAALFRERRIEKRYLAAATGTWTEGEDWVEVDAPIGPERTAMGTRHRVDPAGKPARTRLRLLGRAGDVHLLAAEPLTGRTHQIRVHLRHLGLPLLGDALYGGGESTFLLHCARLAWPRHGNLPAGRFTAPPPSAWRDALPTDLHQLLDTMGREPC